MNVQKTEIDKNTRRITTKHQFYDSDDHSYTIEIGCVDSNTKEILNEEFGLSKNQNWRELVFFSRYGDKEKDRFRAKFKEILDVIDDANFGMVVYPEFYKHDNISSPVKSQKDLIEYYRRKGFTHYIQMGYEKDECYYVRLPQIRLRIDTNESQ